MYVEEPQHCLCWTAHINNAHTKLFEKQETPSETARLYFTEYIVVLFMFVDLKT